MLKKAKTREYFGRLLTLLNVQVKLLLYNNLDNFNSNEQDQYLGKIKAKQIYTHFPQLFLSRAYHLSDSIPQNGGGCAALGLNSGPRTY